MPSNNGLLLGFLPGGYLLLNCFDVKPSVMLSAIEYLTAMFTTIIIITINNNLSYTVLQLSHSHQHISNIDNTIINGSRTFENTLFILVQLLKIFKVYNICQFHYYLLLFTIMI
jgi:hypothetical protein